MNKIDLKKLRAEYKKMGMRIGPISGYFITHDIHKYKIDEECGVEFVIPYGKCKIIQFFYIFNPFSMGAYTYWSSIKVKMYNALWIKEHGKLKYNMKWLKENGN